MSVFYERCPCGAEFRVEADTHDAARVDLDGWRDRHRHEYPPSDKYTDQTGTHQHTGFTTERYGRIEDVQ